MTYSINTDTVLGKVKLNISDMERSLPFYQEVVGLQVLERQGSTASLTADGVNVLIELEEIPNAIVSERRTTTGLYHYALLLPNREALGAALARLIASAFTSAKPIIWSVKRCILQTLTTMALKFMRTGRARSGKRRERRLHYGEQSHRLGRPPCRC